MGEPRAAVVTRGGVVESVHDADVAVVVGDRLVAWFGDPDAVHFPRSSLKPFQAYASYRCGLREAFGIEPGSEELAIMSASHGATDAQCAAVRRLLAKAGLDESALRNGTHEPASAEGRRTLAREGDRPTAIHGNCSGKHAGMLAACVARGWPTEGYLNDQHPCQVHVREVLGEVFGLPPDGLPWGLDGCGLPTYAVPLRRCAAAASRLLVPGEEQSVTLSAVGEAMRRHPRLLGDPDGFNVRLMEVAPSVIAKSGAEAYFLVAVPARRLGVSVKIRDGSARPLAAVVIAVLRQLGALGSAEEEALAEFARPVVRTLAGVAAGEIRAVLELTTG